MSVTDQVLRDLEQRALAEDVPLDEVDTWIAGALGVPVACLYAHLRVTFAAERWATTQQTTPSPDVLAIALPTMEAGS